MYRAPFRESTAVFIERPHGASLSYSRACVHTSTPRVPSTGNATKKLTPQGIHFCLKVRKRFSIFKCSECTFDTYYRLVFPELVQF